MIQHGRSRQQPASKLLKIGVLRAGFALGGCFAPRQTVERAARLFATPYGSSRVRARAVQADDEMQRCEITVGEQTIATYVWGDPTREPYALLVHGWSSFGLRFLPWVARLRQAGLAVVTFDQPGHGCSTGELCTLPDFINTIHAVGRRYGNAALAVGHSLGGAAVTLAQAESWHAKRVVMIAPAADMAAQAERFMRHVRLGEHLRERFFGWHERATGVNVHDLEVRRYLPALGHPCLIVHDLDDPEVPWGDGELYARHWHNSRLLTTQGLGHHRVLDAPDVIEAVLAFVRGESRGERIVGSPNLPYGFA
ncbi:MAG: alpha/beta fold hydrolase [Steroidobacteraceae bacterium]